MDNKTEQFSQEHKNDVNKNEFSSYEKAILENLNLLYSKSIAEYFNCSSDNIEKSLTKTMELILSDVSGAKERENLLDLMQDYLKKNQESKDLKKEQFVHGTGTDALFNIIEKNGMKRRGSKFGGGDVIMKHQIDQIENKERASYVSVAENTPDGFDIAYFYAKGFQGPETNSLKINADKINQSNVILEGWDNLTEEKKKELKEKYGFSREGLAKISERSHFYQPEIEKEKITIYKLFLERLKSGKIPKNTEKIYNKEFHHLIGKIPNNEIVEILLEGVAQELADYPDTNISTIVNEYERQLDEAENTLKEFKNLSPEEQEEKLNQNPVIIYLSKNKINKIKGTRLTENGEEVPIHPSEQERRIYEDIDLSVITDIQAPQAVLEKVREKLTIKLGSTKDEKIKEALKNIKLIPLEFAEIERILRKHINLNKFLE